MWHTTVYLLQETHIWGGVLDHTGGLHAQESGNCIWSLVTSATLTASPHFGGALGSSRAEVSTSQRFLPCGSLHSGFPTTSFPLPHYQGCSSSAAEITILPERSWWRQPLAFRSLCVRSPATRAVSPHQPGEPWEGNATKCATSTYLRPTLSSPGFGRV